MIEIGYLYLSMKIEGLYVAPAAHASGLYRYPHKVLSDQLLWSAISLQRSLVVNPRRKKRFIEEEKRELFLLITFLTKILVPRTKGSTPKLSHPLFFFPSSFDVLHVDVLSFCHTKGVPDIRWVCGS